LSLFLNILIYWVKWEKIWNQSEKI
jgi:hypothetical protein